MIKHYSQYTIDVTNPLTPYLDTAQFKKEILIPVLSLDDGLQLSFYERLEGDAIDGPLISEIREKTRDFQTRAVSDLTRGLVDIVDVNHVRRFFIRQPSMVSPGQCPNPRGFWAVRALSQSEGGYDYYFVSIQGAENVTVSTCLTPDCSQMSYKGA